MNGFSKLITNKIINKEKNDYIKLLSAMYENDLMFNEYKYPLLFINEENKTIQRLFLDQQYFYKYKNSKDYLNKIKEILNLPNDVEKNIGDKKSLLSIIESKDDSYIITNDNFKKMILIFYRIKAIIPVILMGEHGCGKTTLIRKLNQILNNGETLVKIISIYPEITDEDICSKMKEIDKEAKIQPENEIWVLSDKIHNCLSLSLLTEIFINRTYNGETFSENIK